MRVLAALMAALLLAVPGRAAAQSPNAEGIAREVRRLARTGALAEAEALARRAVELSPDIAALWSLLGTVLGMQGRLDEARDALGEAVRLDPENPRFRRDWAVSQWQSGRPAAASESIGRALSADPADPTSLLVGGMIASALGDHELAVERLGAAGEAVDRQAAALAALAASLYHGGRAAEARDALGKVERLHPRPESLAAAANVAFRAGDHDSAARLFGLAEGSGHPRSGRMLFNQALSLFRLERFADARQVLETLLESEPGNADAWSLLGDTLRGAGDRQAAARAFERAIAADPSSERAYLELGSLLAERRASWHAALGTAELAVRRFPASSATHQLKGLVHLRQQHFLDAAVSYGKALELNPDSAEPLVGLVVSLWASGQEDEALEAARNGVRRFPRSAALRHQIARMLVRRSERGDPLAAAQAVHELGEALALDPDFAEAHLELGSLALRRGELRPALESLTKAVELAPLNSRAHYALARCWRRLGNSDEAERAMRKFERTAALAGTSDQQVAVP